VAKIVAFNAHRGDQAALALENDDERIAPRRRMLKAGLVRFSAGHMTIPCAVRDMSEGGARIKGDWTQHIPDHFELHIELDGIWVDCEVAWREGAELGVRFTGPIRQTPPARKQSIQPTAAPNRPQLRRQPTVKRPPFR